MGDEHMTKRVNVYIDGSNFYKACHRELGRTDVNIGKFARKLVGTHHHGRTYYYNVRVSRQYNELVHNNQQRFFAALNRTPYLELRLGRHVRRGSTWMEKGVDMLLGVDLLVHAVKDLYDTAIVVSGDGDFEHAIQAVKDTGKHVEVAFFRIGRSDALLRASDLMTELTRSFFSGLYLGPSGMSS